MYNVYIYYKDSFSHIKTFWFFKRICDLSLQGYAVNFKIIFTQIFYILSRDHVKNKKKTKNK